MENDLISREAALSFPFANGQYDHAHADEHFIFGCETYKEWLEQLPTADVVEVVRCKDCKYAHITYGGEVKYCDIWFPDEKHYIDTDNYCSFAERRTDD